MNNVYTDVFTTIKQLSEIDEKTLTQRALKTAEEVGEMAKYVIPYENGFATTHRFVTDTKILEEAVDTILCALSVAYKLGYDDSDISDMMTQKCVKWSRLQQASIKGRFPIPFEIHVTVRLQHKDEIELFKNSCAQVGVKPIVLDLKEGLQDVMTSSIIVTDNVGAYNELIRISQRLRDFGFNVVRDKIETVPWHPAVPLFKEDINPNRYFECHINIVVNDEERQLLVDWNDQFNVGGHFSKNVFKRINDTDFVQMFTLRSTTINNSYNVNTVGDFSSYIHLVLQKLNELDGLRPGSVMKHTIEYAIYDTNIAHDTSWVTKGE